MFLLLKSLNAIEDRMLQIADRLQFPKSLWEVDAVRLPWLSLMNEIWERQFAGLPNFNSYCGFRNLWSVVDTLARGIQPKGNYTPSIFAYGAVMELAWVLIQEDDKLGARYSNEFEKEHKAPHQFALRRLSMVILKAIWREWAARFKAQ
jgi:hypothetical protein